MKRQRKNVKRRMSKKEMQQIQGGGIFDHTGTPSICCDVYTVRGCVVRKKSL